MRYVRFSYLPRKIFEFLEQENVVKRLLSREPCKVQKQIYLCQKYTNMQWQFRFTFCKISMNQNTTAHLNWQSIEGYWGKCQTIVIQILAFPLQNGASRKKRTSSYSRSWLCPWFHLRAASADFCLWLPIGISTWNAISLVVSFFYLSRCLW